MTSLRAVADRGLSLSAPPGGEAHDAARNSETESGWAASGSGAGERRHGDEQTGVGTGAGQQGSWAADTAWEQMIGSQLSEL